MRFAVMGPGLMSKRQKEARKRQSFPGGLAADLSQASGVAKKAAAPKQKAKGKKAKKARTDFRIEIHLVKVKLHRFLRWSSNKAKEDSPTRTRQRWLEMGYAT